MESRNKFYKHVSVIFLSTVSLLLIPFIAMQFSNEVDWSPFDFIVAAVLLFGTGLAYELLTRKRGSTAYRAAVGIAVGTTLFLIWSNLAVGIIGSEDNPANVLYGAVIAVGFLGSIIARLQPKGMAVTLLAMAITQMLIPLFALIIWSPEFDTTGKFLGIIGVFGANAFFAVLFIGSALLFRNAAQDIQAL